MLMNKSLKFADKNIGRDENKNNITPTKIESTKKILESHCAALNFDKHFVINSVTVDGFNFDEDIDVTNGSLWPLSLGEVPQFCTLKQGHKFPCCKCK